MDFLLIDSNICTKVINLGFIRYLERIREVYKASIKGGIIIGSQVISQTEKQPVPIELRMQSSVG
jgi:hypothetical protein